VLRRIFGPKRDEVTGEWGKLHNEELIDLLPSPSTFRVIKSRRMRYVGRVARMGERKVAYRALVGKPEVKRQLRGPWRRWRTISRRIYRKWVEGAGTGLIWSRIGTVAGLL